MAESLFKAIAPHYGNDTLAMLALTASSERIEAAYKLDPAACHATSLDPLWACLWTCLRDAAVAVAVAFAWAGLREWQVRSARRERRREHQREHRRARRERALREQRPDGENILGRRDGPTASPVA